MVVNVATPDPFRFPVPKVLVPSLKVTLPVGVPVDPEDVSVTVAVNVTESPEHEGFFDDVRAVDVEAAVTVRLPFT